MVCTYTYCFNIALSWLSSFIKFISSRPNFNELKTKFILTILKIPMIAVECGHTQPDSFVLQIY